MASFVWKSPWYGGNACNSHHGVPGSIPGLTFYSNRGAWELSAMQASLAGSSLRQTYSVTGSLKSEKLVAKKNALISWSWLAMLNATFSVIFKHRALFSESNFCPKIKFWWNFTFQNIWSFKNVILEKCNFEN